MPSEIERKFLVKDNSWKQAATANSSMRQAYISKSPGATVRIRITEKRAFLTLKGRANGISRREFEYEIPYSDGVEILEHLALSSVVEKVRYLVPGSDGKVWDVDEFSGANAGLVVAEIELDSEDAAFEIPSWLSVEVTGDPKYYNSNLSVNPYSAWGRE